MLNRDDIEVTVISLATKQGLSLNGKDLLDIRTQVATALAAKKTAPTTDDGTRPPVEEAG